jgi:fibronectin type 3 domain-containing protein
VYRSTTSGGETLFISLGNQLSYKDAATTRGQVYYYQVTAVNSGGEGPRSDEKSAPAT